MEMDVSNNIYKVSKKIKKRELQCLYNALRSIYMDSQFVGEIRQLWPELPLLANLRCGLWYSSSFDSTCYFKSTDGHTGNWSFNLARLNMHVALLAAQRGGCFIVDATRQGKRFPDSFSKTIPIWACVLNRAVHAYHRSSYGNEVEKSLEKLVSSSATDQGYPMMAGRMEGAWDCSLHLPLWVSDTERRKIESRLDEWLDIFWASGADVVSLSMALRKPLWPLWISQDTVVWLNEVPDATLWSFTPIILVSASQQLPRAQRVTEGDCGWNYIPGAADDEESWARGLTPALFWKHAARLMQSSPEDCNRMVAEIVERERVSRAYRGLEAHQVRVKALNTKSGDATCEAQQPLCGSRVEDGYISNPESQKSCGLYWIGDTKLAVGSVACVPTAKEVCCAIYCGPDLSLESSFEPSCYLHLPIVDSKHDRFCLQKHLAEAVKFAKEKLMQQCSLLTICADGEDLSVCVCLTILLSLFNIEGVFNHGLNLTESGVSKWDIRQRLVYLCKYAPNARPSRRNLRQVFQCLSGIGTKSSSGLTEAVAKLQIGPTV